MLQTLNGYIDEYAASAYVSFENDNLKNGDRIETTQPALVLENLIGQLIYGLKSQKTDKGESNQASSETTTTSNNGGQQ